MRDIVWWKIEVAVDVDDVDQQVAYAGLVKGLCDLVGDPAFDRISPRLEDDYDRRRAADRQG